MPAGWSAPPTTDSKAHMLRGPYRPGSIASSISFTRTTADVGLIAFVDQFIADHAREESAATLLAREAFALRGETVVRLKSHVKSVDGKSDSLRSVYLIYRPKLQFVVTATTPLEHPADGIVFDEVVRSLQIESDSEQPPRPNEQGPFDPAIDLAGRYHDLAGGFSYSVPEGWGPKYLIGPLHVLSLKANASPDDSRFISFNRFTRPEMPESTVGRLASNFTAPESGNRLVDIGSFPTLDGLRATRLICAGVRPTKSGSEAVRRRIGFVCTLGLQYVATLETPAVEGDALDALFDEVLKSFRIEDQTYAARTEAEPARCFEPSAGVSYVPPEDWELLGSPTEICRTAVATSANGKLEAAIGVKRHDAPGSLDQAADALIAEATAETKSLRVVERKNRQLGNGLAGLQWTMEGTLDDALPPIRVTAFLTATNEAKCSLALIHPATEVAAYEPIFAAVVESLRIEPMPENAGAPIDPATAAEFNSKLRPLPLPTDPQAWLNSPPLTTESLAGKVAFFWFFDEQCPRCYQKWPELTAIADSFKDQGVMFIAVNSGTQRSDLDYYVKQVKLAWPVIIDADRRVEAAADIGTISLQNIWQTKLMLPDGTTVDGNFCDIAGSINAALGKPADGDAAAIASTAPATSTIAAEDEATPVKRLSLPTDADAWLNAPPLSDERLAGKAVFLWFFEEDCPRCARRWSDLIDLAERYADRPVVFIAVNSGTPRAELQEYVKSVKLKWPLIVDAERKLEAEADVKPISLQNIWQLRLILPDGRLIDGNWSDVAGSLEAALPGAKWRIDPTGIPEALRDARRQIELGEYAAAALALKASAEQPEHAEAVMKLRAAAIDDMHHRIVAAKQLRDDGRSWEAYKAYAATKNDFRDFDPPAEIAAAMQELEAIESVAIEVKAARQWDAMKRTYQKSLLSKSILDHLNRFVGQFPGTEAAGEAQEILDRVAAAKADD